MVIGKRYIVTKGNPQFHVGDVITLLEEGHIGCVGNGIAGWLDKALVEEAMIGMEYIEDFEETERKIKMYKEALKKLGDK